MKEVIQTAGVPSPAQAEALLREAVAANPGPWEAHSRTASTTSRSQNGAPSWRSGTNSTRTAANQSTP